MSGPVGDNGIDTTFGELCIGVDTVLPHHTIVGTIKNGKKQQV